MSIPGWDSVAGSHWWSNVYFWGSIFSLILLGITEIVSHRYSERKDELSAIEQEATKKAHENEIARLHVEANRLAANTESARAAIAESKAREKEAELKLAQLEKKVTPRVIDDEQSKNIVEKIKPFSGTPFAVESDPAAEYGFVNRVIEILQRAGWKWLSYSVSPMSLPPGDRGGVEIPADLVSGVQVRINASRSADFRKPTEALAFALTQALKAGVGMVFDPPESPLACSPDVIHIQIGRKL